MINAKVLCNIIKELTAETVTISTPFIRLDALLKFKGEAETGGQAKQMIQDGLVKVNGKTCTARGKKIKPGDVVVIHGTDYTIQQ